MAGNSVFTGQDGNIYVNFDVQNLIVVDPNKLQDNDGKIKDRLVDHENLVMYANLETKLLPRTKLAVGATVENNVSVVNIAEINFMKPGGQKYLSNDYTNQMTGLGLYNRGTTNKTSGSFVTNTTQKDVSNQIAGDPRQTQLDTGLLGITSINVKLDTSFTPQVTIELEDVQGRALFEKGDLSPYAAFFNLPYPPFFLTLKGFYGQAIRYQLNLMSFNARFNTFSGNYQITLQFVGYKFNILNEISLGALFAVPHMYESTYSVSYPQPNSKNSSPLSYTMEGGTEKIKEVYQDYKQKGLIPEDFPELSVNELLNRLELFTQNYQKSFTEIDTLSLTESVNYRETLTEYSQRIYFGPTDTAWFEQYCDKAKAIRLKDFKETFYPLTKEAQANSTKIAIPELQSRINTYNDKLNSNPFFGLNGPNKDLIVPNTIDINDIKVSVTSQEIDFKETLKLRKNLSTDPTVEEIALFQTTLEIELLLRTEKMEGKSSDTNKIDLFVFEGATRFTGLINQMTQALNSNAQKEEERLTAILAAKFENKASGVGFRPTIRNVITVIMASTEAFIRLMDDVHKKAWDKRDDLDRKTAVLKYPSSDAKDLVVLDDNEKSTPIYPWPQYFQQEEKGERFVLVYPGDKASVNQTKAYLYEKWPEVQFVEEFFKGFTERGMEVRQTTQKDNEEKSIQRLSLNGIEFPQSNLPYSNKEEVKFFYEIWERTYLNSHYNRFQRGGDVKEIYNIIGSNEAQNLVTALGISPTLVGKLKNYGFNFENYLGVLSHISNQGTGPSIQKLIRDVFVTPYIETETNDAFKIYDKSVIESSGNIVDRGLTSQDLTNFDNLIKKNVEPDLCDVFPFTDPLWNRENLETSSKAGAGLFYNTKDTLFVNSQNKVIANFNKDTTENTIRPVTSFCYKNFSQPVLNNGLYLFYTERTKPEAFNTTEGTVNADCASLPSEQTTSILNTPYFVNAIQNGVNNWVNKVQSPFVQGAYLLLNSLPLETLRGTYKTEGNKDPLDYIASSMKRFGGIHKVPYAWVLKIGSIYHRYKRKVNDNIDILDSCWKDFEFVKNFDPISNNINKSYELSFEAGTTTDVFLQEQDFDSNPITMTTVESTYIQGGFYPKLINDFSYFFNGKPCFSAYTDSEIQLYTDQNLKVGATEFENMYTDYVLQGIEGNQLNLNPWTVLMKNSGGDSYYTVPSFGSTVSQVVESVLNTGSRSLERDLMSNPAIYNGTVRMFWGAPNYGYFSNNSSYIKKPEYNEYMCLVEPFKNILSPMNLGLKYSSIEDIFSVFNKEQLDLFEEKFLNFSKSVYDFGEQVGTSQPSITLNVDTTDPDRYLKNFQLMVREMMEVVIPQNQGFQDYIQTTINNQFGNVINILNNFMNYDVVIKNGNPSNYKRKLFDSFLPDYETGYDFTDTTAGQTRQVPFVLIDPYKFNPYIPGSLPTPSGTTFAQSYVANVDAWKELRLQIGESTIPELSYFGPSSFITDFFIDNNVEFTKENVITCAPLIKIYATQKLKNNTLTGSQFKTLIQNYSNGMIKYQKNVFNNLITYLQQNLPNVDSVPEKTIKSSVEGNLLKAQIYEMFKALNDKWIAGNAYNEETLMQDIIFLDRASRNVGDEILIDVFALKNKLRNLDLNASVYILINGLLTESHFTVMPLPAYVNFYGIPTPSIKDETPKTEASIDFANNLWGTFLSVDYRNSQPKLLCFYSEKPSNYPNLGRNKDFRYKNDGFACTSLTDNPLFENQSNKTDWSQSNRCIGFVVDMGVRNQGVFSSFSVSQDIGNATSEALIATNQLANQASGRQSVSQTVSLLNIYNERSYSCNVVSLGNAMLQPMMYFCLNHVPMFNGAYLIQEVNHTITPGTFQTSITGVRQRVFASVKPNNYLMSLNQNLLQRLREDLKNGKTAPVTTGQVNQTSNKTNAAPNTCQDSILQQYKDNKFTSIEANKTSIKAIELVSKIKAQVPDLGNTKLNSQLAMMTYLTAFVSSSNKDGTLFESFGNNYSNLDLKTVWTTDQQKIFQKEFCCVNVGTDKGEQSVPFVRFETVEKFLELPIGKLKIGRAHV